MGKMAGICYNSDITNDEKNYKRGINCLKSGHFRVAEFPQVFMILDGYSARVIREYMRHVGDGLTVLQASTRYIDYAKEGIDYITPHNVDPFIYNDVMYEITESARNLEKLGADKEDIANILPLGMATKIVDKKNFRVLMDMSHNRMCTTAYWEFRSLFQDLCNALALYSEEWAYLVQNYFKPKCEVCGYCNEGKRSCGRRPLEKEFNKYYEEYLEKWKLDKKKNL